MACVRSELRTLEVFFAFYAPTTLFTTLLRCFAFSVYAGKRRRVFAANFQQLIAL